MITPERCVFLAHLEGESASLLAEKLSPTAALDIAEITIVSSEFDNDIEGMLYFDERTADLKRLAHVSEEDIREEINPMYLPVSMKEVDAVLDVDTRRDSYIFDGMDGNPFTIKMMNAGTGDQQTIQARLRYMPFDLPSYMELVEEHGQMSIN
jgi:hypothetical protein